MRYLKTYKNINTPEVGDYVLVKKDANIRQISKALPNQYLDFIKFISTHEPHRQYSK